MTRHSIAICASAAILAACASNSSPTSSAFAPGAPLAPGAAIRAMVPAPAAQSIVALRPDRHKSWVSPAAKRAPRLLFISDYGADAVYILTMPGMALKGTLTGFDFPEGECTDASGNIWIANTGAMEMELYSRSGTLLRTLSVTDEYPAGCAVNLATGDLAVANIENSSGGAGNITIFAGATGSGTPYTVPSMYEYFFVGYDPYGNLYFDGTNASRTSAYLGEIPSGVPYAGLISLVGGTLHLPGFVQWYAPGNYLALGDQECGGETASCIYSVSVSASVGTITGTINLSNYEGGAVCDLVQGVIGANAQKYLVGPDYDYCGYTPITANRWSFPSGGEPTNYNNSTPFVEPLGAAISAK
jgi:hypothetical protein